MVLAELRGFQDLFTCHTEFAVMLAGLCVRVMRMNGDPGEEAQPNIYVTLSPSALLRINFAKSLVRGGRDSPLATLTQNEMDVF
jgi:hypothetical protein